MHRPPACGCRSADNRVGQWATDGEIPDDEAMLSQLIQDVCFNNAKGYFDRKSLLTAERENFAF